MKYEYEVKCVCKKCGSPNNFTDGVTSEDKSKDKITNEIKDRHCGDPLCDGKMEIGPVEKSIFEEEGKGSNKKLKLKDKVNM